MSSNFQSSFIPKDSEQNGFSKEKPSFLAMISLIIFSISVLGAIGLITYKMILKNSNENLKMALIEAERNIDRNKINDILTIDKKLQLSQSILARHEVISNFMKDLASSTVSNVVFKEFSYGNLDNSGISVTMSGSAPSYSAVAFQESIFLQNSNYRKVSFSDLRLGENGRVTFSISILLDPKISIYSPNISNVIQGVPNTDSDEETLDNNDL